MDKLNDLTKDLTFAINLSLPSSKLLMSVFVDEVRCIKSEIEVDKRDKAY